MFDQLKYVGICIYFAFTTEIAKIQNQPRAALVQRRWRHEL